MMTDQKLFVLLMNSASRGGTATVTLPRHGGPPPDAATRAPRAAFRAVALRAAGRPAGGRFCGIRRGNHMTACPPASCAAMPSTGSYRGAGDRWAS
jgi:hypothetical protein